MTKPRPGRRRFGKKGSGEVGIVGAAGAIASAAYHATGKRVRPLPLTIGKRGG